MDVVKEVDYRCPECRRYLTGIRKYCDCGRWEMINGEWKFTFSFIPTIEEINKSYV